MYEPWSLLRYQGKKSLLTQQDWHLFKLTETEVACIGLQRWNPRAERGDQMPALLRRFSAIENHLHVCIESGFNSHTKLKPPCSNPDLEYMFWLFNNKKQNKPTKQSKKTTVGYKCLFLNIWTNVWQLQIPILSEKKKRSLLGVPPCILIELF